MKAKTHILCHLSKYQYNPQATYQPGATTQKGIADEIKTSRAYAGEVLKELESGGLIKKELGRVKGEKRRINVYSITENGREKVGVENCYLRLEAALN